MIDHSELQDILVGARLVELSQDYMLVQKDGVEIRFDFVTDGVECCGFANIETTLLTDDIKEMPAIVKLNFEDSKDERFGGRFCTVNLIGASKQLGRISAEAGSASGWEYGAFASVKCAVKNFEHILAEW